MTRELVYALGPELADPGVYTKTGTAGIISIVTTPAPRSSLGTRRFKLTGTGTVNKEQWQRVGSNLPTAKLYKWPVTTFRLDGTLTAGQLCEFTWWPDGWRLSGRIVAVALAWEYVTASTFKLSIRTKDGVNDPVVFGTTTTTYATGVDHTIRIQTDGGHLCSMWVDGVLEVSAGGLDAYAPGQLGVCASGGIYTSDGIGLASGQVMYIDGLAIFQGDSDADRPGVDVWRSLLVPNGDTSESGYYSQVGACGVDNGTYTNWDDWAGGGSADDATTFNCGNGTVDSQEVSSLTTATIIGTVAGWIPYVRARANVASKTVATWLRMKSGASVTELAMSNLNSTTYGTESPVIQLPPGGGAWSQSVVDALELGSRAVITNDANAEVTAIAAEIFAVDNDPPVPTGGGIETVRVAQEGNYDTTFLDIRYSPVTHFISSAICQNGRPEGGGAVYWRIEDGVTGSFVEGFVEMGAFSDQDVDPAKELKYIPNPTPPPSRLDNTSFFLG